MIVSPGDGKVVAVQGHAIGVRLDLGVDLLIHVGIDTVGMRGEGFESFVKRGERVTVGQRLMAFDKETIISAGHPAITPVLITNWKKVGGIETIAHGDISYGDDLLKLTPQEQVTGQRTINENQSSTLHVS